ncbi:hypothetical protein VNO77_00223 [Canavalia gladiata]|uniref:Peptidase A1 domain-containing protein n=1 Tax=Canavalia gladiata TaxID=3824 RepID=A0AAN9R476_CANGL
MTLVLNSSFIILSLFFSILCDAKASSSKFSTSVLNVTQQLHQSHQVLSLKPTATLKPSPSSSSSLQLHTRDSLFNAHHKNYRSLVITRLTRDSARVSHILSKLSHVSNPSKTELLPEGLSVPVESGISSGSGEYFTRIGVGQPSRPFYMVLDTGSDVSWLQCKPCPLCYQQSDPLFDPSTSSSHAPVSCEAQPCRQLVKPSCINNWCQYRVEYGDGSYTQGHLVTETMSLGNTSLNQVVMGCGHFNLGLFRGAAGVLGLGGGPLSFTTQIKATSFSYCLVNRDSDKSSTLEFNSTRPNDSVTTKLLRNPNLSTFYYVELVGVSVGGQSVPLPDSVFVMNELGRGGVIIDSGTSITRLQTQAYEAVRDMFVAMTRHLPRTKPFQLLDTCYDLSLMKTVRVPTMSFELKDGKLWMLPVNGYLIPVDTNGTFCFAFAPSPGQVSIIGNVQQQGTRVSFDLPNSIIGFSSLKC